MLGGAQAVISDAVRTSSSEERRDVALMEDKIRDEFRRYLARKTSRQSQPLIVPVVLEG